METCIGSTFRAIEWLKYQHQNTALREIRKEVSGCRVHAQNCSTDSDP
jgi:hypothetical protein